jgi:predicted nucleic acid-binding protein
VIAVSDTSPLNYLILIELQHILPKLFDRVLIPEAVRRELESAGAPDPIRRFLADAPAWLDIRPSPDIDATLAALDAGEREVIALALASNADAVLLDEKKGRQVAKRSGLHVSGTLALVVLAVEYRFVTLDDALTRLQQTNFRVSEKVIGSLRAGFRAENP